MVESCQTCGRQPVARREGTRLTCCFRAVDMPTRAEAVEVWNRWQRSTSAFAAGEHGLGPWDANGSPVEAV